MNEAELIRLLLAGSGGAVIWQSARVGLDAWRGAKADEREQIALAQRERADANEGFDKLVEQLSEALTSERARSDRLAEAGDRQRARLDIIQEELDVLQDQNRALSRRGAIWREAALQYHQDILDGRPPPPRDLPIT